MQFLTHNIYLEVLYPRKIRTIFLLIAIMLLSSFASQACTPTLTYVSYYDTGSNLGPYNCTWTLFNNSYTCTASNYRLGNPDIYRRVGNSWVHQPNISLSFSTSYPTFTIGTRSNNQARAQNITLINVTQTGTYRVYFEIKKNTGAQLPNLCQTYPGKCRLYLEVNVTSIPVSCPTPSNLHINSGTTTTTSAQIDWNGVSGVQYYQFRYGTSTSNYGNPITAYSSYYNLSGLSAGTCYYWQVRTRCTNGTYSPWSSSDYFCTNAQNQPLTIVGSHASPSSGFVNTTNFNFSCQVTGGNGSNIAVFLDFLDYNGTPITMGSPNNSGHANITRPLSGIGTNRPFRYTAIQNGVTVHSQTFYVTVTMNCNTIANLEDEMVSRQVWCQTQECRDYISVSQINKDIDRIVLHHGGDELKPSIPTWEDMLNVYYRVHKNNGWGDIGYHYVVSPTGVIYEGRAGGELKIGTHTGGNSGNFGTIGVMLLGNYNNNSPSQAMLESLNRLLVYLCTKHNINPQDHKLMPSHIAPSPSLALVNNEMPRIEGHLRYGRLGNTPTSCPGGIFYPTIQTAVRDKVDACLNVNTNLPNYSLKTIRLLGSIVKNGKIARLNGGTPKYIGQTDEYGFSRCIFYPELAIGDTLEISAMGYTPFQIVVDAAMVNKSVINIPVLAKPNNQNTLQNPYINILGRSTISLDTFVTVEVGGTNVQNFEYLHDTTWMPIPSNTFSYPLYASHFDEQDEGEIRAINIRAITNNDTVFLHKELILLDTTQQAYNTLSINLNNDNAWLYIDGIFDSNLSSGVQTLTLPKHAVEVTLIAQGYYQQTAIVNADTSLTINLQAKNVIGLSKMVAFQSDSIQYVGEGLTIKQRIPSSLLTVDMIPNNQLNPLSPLMVRLTPSLGVGAKSIDFVWYLDDTISYVNNNYNILIQNNGQLHSIVPANFGDSISFDPINKVLKVFGLTGSETVAIVSNSVNLPIELSQFKATKGTEPLTVDINWSTLSETNASTYEIEHSDNGGLTFKKIGELKAKGNSNSLLNYHYIHNNPILGWNYYRLKLIDLDNTFTYSSIAAVNFDDDLFKDIVIYPNPTTQNATIQYHTLKEDGMLQLVNVLGEVIWAKKLKAQTISETIELANLPSGTYILNVKLSSSNDLSKNFKIIKK